MRAWTVSVALLGAVACGGAAAGTGSVSATAGEAAEEDPLRLAWSAWREERHAELAGPDGWLTLVGLHWLEEGESTVGSEPTARVRLSEGPARIGRLVRAGAAVDFVPEAPGVVTLEGAPLRARVTLRSDTDGDPAILEVGSLRMHLITRGDRIGLRVRDRESPARVAFGGVPVYDYDPRWRVRARLEPAEPGEVLPIVNVLGMQVDEPLAGRLRFELGGRPMTLSAIAGGEALFVMLRDATSESGETYGGGRYLSVERPDASGETWVDLNFAYTPPCAFTELATCPLAPFENTLPIAVTAGERYAH